METTKKLNETPLISEMTTNQSYILVDDDGNVSRIRDVAKEYVTETITFANRIATVSYRQNAVGINGAPDGYTFSVREVSPDRKNKIFFEGWSSASTKNTLLFAFILISLNNEGKFQLKGSILYVCSVCEKLSCLNSAANNFDSAIWLYINSS